MKRLRNTFLIIGSVAIVAAIVFIICINATKSENNTGKGIKIEMNGLESITLVNDKIGQGKLITKSDDIKAVCEIFNSTEMTIIENWKGQFERDGGNSFTFQFNYKSGATRAVGYYDGSYLIEGSLAYDIHSTEFEKFWNLNYPVQKWDYQNNRFKLSE